MSRLSNLLSKERGKWSSRKFWAAMTWQVVLTGVLIYGGLSEETYESLTYLLLGGYFLSNVAEKKVAKDRDKG